MQTPLQNGVWHEVRATDDISIAEYAVIFDSDPYNEAASFPAARKIYISREALDSRSIKRYSAREYKHFSFWNGSGYLPVKWSYTDPTQTGAGYSGIELNYRELMELRVPPKTKLICSTLSSKTITRGHRIRLKFTKKFMADYAELDVYGSAPFANSSLIGNSKVKTLLPYAFQLAFDNQCHLKDFVGTQFTDSLLLWSKPIFWGSRDVFKFYPKNSFLWFDAEKPKREIPRIVEQLCFEGYIDSLSAIEEARDLVLNTYNFWPTLGQILDNEEP